MKVYCLKCEKYMDFVKKITQGIITFSSFVCMGCESKLIVEVDVTIIEIEHQYDTSKKKDVNSSTTTAVIIPHEER